MRKILAEKIRELQFIDSVIGLVGVLLVLGGALYIQIFYKEQPCPLCLLQRAAFVNVGLCLLLNVRHRNKASHWALAILSGCAGVAVSLRQISLHITSPVGFGSEVLGWHMYTWSFVVFAAVIVGCALMLLIYPEKR